MSKRFKKIIKNLLELYLKKKLKSYISIVKKDLLENEKYIAIDVGAALGIQRWWYEVLEFATIYAYEPHKESAKELEQLYANYDYSVFNEALDQESTVKDIYLTNVRTGSSLLKPNEEYIYNNPNYILPYTIDSIKTVATGESLVHHNILDVDLMKIDTQGTELNILKGLSPEYLNKLLAIEFEAGLPGGYINQPNFLDVHIFMKENNFDLFDLRSARGTVYFKKDPGYLKSKKVSQKIHEVDVLYFKDLQYVLNQQSKSKLRKLLISYCVYSFFDEALYALEQSKYYQIFNEEEIIKIKNAIIIWHDAKTVFYGHYHWFNYNG